jgi:nucleotide-binding universal stress UspA family protein
LETQVDDGRPSEVLLERAAGWPADLIVIGAKGLSAPGEFRLGSTAHKLAHYVECSVLVARPSERAQPLSVILASDGSHEAQRAAEFLCALKLPQWAEVTVVSVAEVAAGEGHPVADIPEAVQCALLDTAEARAAGVAARLGGCDAHVRKAVRLGHPAGEILTAAREQDADLIVVGARGQPRAEPFRLGGVAQKIVKYAPCSVLVVR